MRTSILEVLPTNEQSRTEWLVGLAFFIRAMREPAMAAVAAEGVPKVVAFFAEQLGAARDDGLLVDGADPFQEASLLWAVTDSLATAIVLGQRTADDAVATVDYHLGRLFVAPS